MEREKCLELVTPEAARVCSCHGAAEALRHDQVLMCAFCKQAPASVRCKADAAALCAACDADIHFSNPFTRRHERLPLPNPSTKPPASGVDGFLFGSVNGVDEDEDKLETPWWLLPEPPPEMRLAAPHRLSSDYASSADASFGQADSIVPEQGEAKLPSNNGVLEINFAQFKPSNDSHWVLPAAAIMDREARVMRYREKRKNRRFQKTIRYASRKAYAETRPRVKGRFAKRTDDESEADWVCQRKRQWVRC